MRDIEEIRAECERRQYEAAEALDAAIAREQRARLSGNFNEMLNAVDAVRSAQAQYYHVHA